MERFVILFQLVHARRMMEPCHFVNMISTNVRGLHLTEATTWWPEGPKKSDLFATSCNVYIGKPHGVSIPKVETQFWDSDQFVQHNVVYHPKFGDCHLKLATFGMVSVNTQTTHNIHFNLRHTNFLAAPSHTLSASAPQSRHASLACLASQR